MPDALDPCEVFKAQSVAQRFRSICRSAGPSSGRECGCREGWVSVADLLKLEEKAKRAKARALEGGALVDGSESVEPATAPGIVRPAETP
jgi:hypothetical protein